MIAAYQIRLPHIFLLKVTVCFQQCASSLRIRRAWWEVSACNSHLKSAAFTLPPWKAMWISFLFLPTFLIPSAYSVGFVSNPSTHGKPLPTPVTLHFLILCRVLDSYRQEQWVKDVENIRHSPHLFFPECRSLRCFYVFIYISQSHI